MENRRAFIKASAAAMAGAAAKSALGANDKIQMAIIGTGNRGGRVFDSLVRHDDCRFLAAAEVNNARLTQWMNPARQTFNLQTVGDYRKILDRKDIDAVLIATPDFSHSQIMVDAISAGKDVYVEKPASNTVTRINAMMDAYNKGQQVVQVGTHQRSWDHFIEARNILNTGTLGTVSHVIINQPGSYARAKEAEQPVPAGLDWDMWQGDAPKRAFKPSRLAFRGWYAYGSGMVGDWGAHHVDVGLWFMNADGKAPLVTMANSGFFTVPDADPEEVPDTFSISWKFDNFIMTFANAVESESEGIEKWGVYFIGNRGWMQVNRQGWQIHPVVGPVVNKQGPPPPPTAGGVTLGAGGVAIAAGEPGGGRGGSGGGRGGRGGGNANLPPVEAHMYVNPRGGVEEDYPLHAHTRNFLDCVKSRSKKTNAPMEIGYSSALPCLIALECMQKNKILGWDAAKRQTVVL
jgi:predicted dehydrogenase